ncbi:MAG: hypothetical protein ACI4R6_00785, partial [Lachnospiraceae bacterium]
GESEFNFGDGSLIRILSFKINGEEVNPLGSSVTVGSDGDTKLYLYNQWVPKLTGRMCNYGFGEGSALLVNQEMLSDVRSIEIKFGYEDARIYPAAGTYTNQGASQAANTGSETTLSPDAKTMARLVYVPGEWQAAFWGMNSPDTYNMDGIVAEYAQITGPGQYSTTLDFTGTSAGSFDGVEFAALYIDNGETLFPGYTIRIDQILINGEPVSFGKPYTTTEDESTTRVNLYNVWVAEWISGRSSDGNMEGATSMILSKEQLQGVKTITVNFTYISDTGAISPGTGAHNCNYVYVFILCGSLIAFAALAVIRRRRSAVSGQLQ